MSSVAIIYQISIQQQLAAVATVTVRESHNSLPQLLIGFRRKSIALLLNVARYPTRFNLLAG